MKKTGKLWVALITALSLAMPMNVWADTKISSISLKIDSSIEAGDSNNDVDVTTSSRYCSVDDVEVTNEPSDEWKSGARPKIKVTLSSDGDAYFGTGITKSDISVSGNDASVTSVSRSGKYELTVSLTLEKLDRDSSDYDLDVTGLSWDDYDGTASWEEPEDAKKYEVRLYRDGSTVSSIVTTSFSNFAMSGINKRHFGLEAAASVPIYAGLSLNAAISWGQFTYDNNPDYVQIQDNSGEIKNQGKVYWKNFRVESTPQTALNVGLSYRGPKNIFASLDMNYYNNMYLSMSPLYRTDAVLTPGMTEEDIATLRNQEKFNSACVLNASVGKNWYINRAYTLGFSLEVKNLLNNQNIKTGGYEQVRLLKNKDESYQTYQPFDSKYFYMFGTTYYMNIYFRF